MKYLPILHAHSHLGHILLGHRSHDRLHIRDLDGVRRHQSVDRVSHTTSTSSTLLNSLVVSDISVGCDGYCRKGENDERVHVERV
jgi:hypothetical protein